MFVLTDGKTTKEIHQSIELESSVTEDWILSWVGRIERIEDSTYLMVDGSGGALTYFHGTVHVDTIN